MHKILIGTNNRAKTKAVETAVRLYYPDAIFVNQEVPSMVSEQPMSNEETRQGAINRARNVIEMEQGTFGIGSRWA